MVSLWWASWVGVTNPPWNLVVVVVGVFKFKILKYFKYCLPLGLAFDLRLSLWLKVHQDEWFKFLKFLRQFWNFVWLMRSEGLVRLLQWFDWVGNQGKSIYIWFNFLFLKDYVLFVFSLFLQSICVPSSRLIVSFPFQHLLNLLLLL